MASCRQLVSVAAAKVEATLRLPQPAPPARSLPPSPLASMGKGLLQRAHHTLSRQGPLLWAAAGRRGRCSRHVQIWDSSPASGWAVG